MYSVVSAELLIQHLSKGHGDQVIPKYVRQGG